MYLQRDDSDTPPPTEAEKNQTFNVQEVWESEGGGGTRGTTIQQLHH